MSENMKYCSRCGAQIFADAEICPKCGVRVKLVNAQVQSSKNPGVAAVLSFFFTGLGQFYNGQFKKGVMFILLGIVCVGLMIVFIGFILYPILLIYNIYDAYKSAERINRGQS
jgi:TM2 domain-containing membrane protein YozV